MVRSITIIAVLTAVTLWLSSCAEIEPMPWPKINLKTKEYEVNINDSAIISPKIMYDYDSKYEWVLNGEVVWRERVLKYKAITPETLNYTFIVTTPSGSDTADITVQGLYILNFSEFKMKKDTLLFGQNGETYYNSGPVYFPTQYIGPLYEWDGFAVSNGINKTEKELKNRFSAYCAVASDTIQRYLVFHQDNDGPTYDMYFEPGVNRRLKSVEVTNTTYLYYVIKKGTTTIKAFGENNAKDWFKLNIEGIDADGNKISQIDALFFLADYTNDIITKRYVVESWKEIDLAKLGAVNKVRFTLTSSQNDANGMITPGYVCIDNLKIID